MKECDLIMVLWSMLIFLIMVSSNEILLFSTFVSITDKFSIVASMRIIKMVYLNGQSAWSLKCPVSWCFTCLFAWRSTLVQNFDQWILFMPPTFTITCPIMRISRLLISSPEINTPITSLKIFTCGVVLSKFCNPRFNKVSNPQNGIHDLVAGSLLNSFQNFK